LFFDPFKEAIIVAKKICNDATPSIEIIEVKQFTKNYYMQDVFIGFLWNKVHFSLPNK
jgi:hypothetical protein